MVSTVVAPTAHGGLYAPDCARVVLEEGGGLGGGETA